MPVFDSPVSRSKTLTFLSAAAAPALALMLAATPAAAQAPNDGNPPSAQSLEGRDSCNSAGKAEAATAPDRQSADGTAPGNSGSTGWTGGTGGAQVGTNPQGALPESKTWQPPTARGLDLAMALPDNPPAANTAAADQGC